MERSAGALGSNSGGQAEALADRLLDRADAMIGAEVEAFGDDEFGFDPHEVEHAAKIGFEMLEGGGGGTCAVNTAAGDRDDHAPSAGQALGPVRSVTKRLAGDHQAVDPRF